MWGIFNGRPVSDLPGALTTCAVDISILALPQPVWFVWFPFIVSNKKILHVCVAAPGKASQTGEH